MNDLITSYLIQTGECVLPGLGTLSVVTQPAKYDVAAKEMIAPVTQVHFREKARDWNSMFIDYTASKTGWNTEATLGNLQQWIEQTKAELSNGREIIFATLGSLGSVNGNTEFVNVPQNTFLQNVPAERAIRKEAKHAVIVGDKESTNTEMNDYLTNAASKKTKQGKLWKIAAAVILLIGLGALAYHFYHHNSIGNQTPVVPGNTPETYISK